MLIHPEVHYNTYLQIGVVGLQGLAYYSAEQKAWGEAHKRVSGPHDP